jgi:hypothetical protein
MSFCSLAAHLEKDAGRRIWCHAMRGSLWRPSTSTNRAAAYGVWTDDVAEILAFRIQVGQKATMLHSEPFLPA